MTTLLKIRWVALFLFVPLLLAKAQDSETKVTKQDLQWIKQVLNTTRDDIKKRYYDSKFHGLDVDGRFQQAWEKIQSAPTRNHAVADIAGAVSALHDSHTFFVPPPRPYVHEYGWRMKAEGESDCFITAVRPGSDAEKKGVKPGDQVLSVAGYDALREDVWKIEYVYRTLRPQPGLRLVLRTPEGATKQLDVLADLRPRTKDPWKQLDEMEATWKSHKPRSVEYGRRAIVFRLSDFRFDADEANKMLNEIRKHDALILDLRGNPGGSVEFLERFLGGMFDHDLKIADRIGRNPMHASIAKSRGSSAFAGKIVVLVDSDSGSAAEVFARVMQLESRGTVVGDRSSGKVMESRMHVHDVETMGGVFRFGVTITEADVIMTDGKSLENNGVRPDERVVPLAADLAAGRDTALARAAQIVGVNLSPEEAGKIFPFEWPTEY